jgi:tricorn protease
MKKLITSLALALTALSGYAITPLWMRDARISPNGTEIVFCYKGDIYKVPAQGGTAVQLTTQASYEANPVWSPDGKQIAFASDRNGNFDLFIMPADGGTKADLSFRFGDSFGFYSGRKVCTFLRIYSRPRRQRFVSYRSNDGIV